MPEGGAAPKGADVVGWTNLLVDRLASDASAERLRSYIKKTTRETWAYVNWLTHAKNAREYDAEFGVAAVSHLLASVTATRLRWARHGNRRCKDCGSYSLAAGQCQRCGWVDPNYEPPATERPGKKELAARLSEPCTPSSDISTLMTPRDIAGNRPNGD